MPKNGRAYLSRAVNRRRIGEPATALGDLEKAAQAGIEENLIRRERGYAQWDLEQHHEAVRELDRALELGSDPGAYRARALVHFSLGDWSRAEADLNRLLTVARPRTGEYAEFFRLLARRRAKIDDQPAAFSAVVSKWPPSWANSIGRYLTGDLSEVQLLAEANVDLTPPAAERRCEAYFYIAQTHLIAGDTVSAQEYFEKCVGTGIFNYFEYKIARAELNRLRVGR